jgi:hypothetical protein
MVPRLGLRRPVLRPRLGSVVTDASSFAACKSPPREPASALVANSIRTPFRRPRELSEGRLRGTTIPALAAIVFLALEQLAEVGAAARRIGCQAFSSPASASVRRFR